MRYIGRIETRGGRNLRLRKLNARTYLPAMSKWASAKARGTPSKSAIRAPAAAKAKELRKTFAQWMPK